MTSISKNVQIDQIDEIAGKYHRTIIMKPVDVNSSIHIDFRNIFAKGYV